MFFFNIFAGGGSRAHGVFIAGFGIPPAFGEAQGKDKDIGGFDTPSKGLYRVPAGGQGLVDTFKTVGFYPGPKGVVISAVFFPHLIGDGFFIHGPPGPLPQERGGINIPGSGGKEVITEFPGVFVGQACRRSFGNKPVKAPRFQGRADMLGKAGTEGGHPAFGSNLEGGVPQVFDVVNSPGGNGGFPEVFFGEGLVGVHKG